MMKLTFEIGGRTVSPDDIGGSLADAMERTVVQALAHHYEEQLSVLRCPLHHGGPQVFVSGPSLDELSLTLRGCCQELIDAARAALNAEEPTTGEQKMQPTGQPKVFVSHAGEDKERFVLSFATKLRAAGVDAWVDRWEMLPGDSIVRKIFDEGLENAQAVIVVLSSASVTKPWVREEMDAAFVRRIETKSKLIPVVLDLADSAIPSILKTIVWERIRDLNSYETELQRIVMAIYGVTDKPALGQGPAYTRTALDMVPGLSTVDSLVLRAIGDEALQVGRDLIMPTNVEKRLEDHDVSGEALTDSLQVLENHHYIELHWSNAGIIYMKATHYGFEQYAKAYIPNYQSIIYEIAHLILNTETATFSGISTAINQPEHLVEHILDSMENRKLVTLSKWMQDGRVQSASPELRRKFQER
jgi:hypothetical protein